MIKIEKGKWYRNNKWPEVFIAKASHVIKDGYAKLYFTESILDFADNSEEIVHEYKNDWAQIDKGDIREVPISEIAQYLPNTHPDKVAWLDEQISNMLHGMRYSNMVKEYIKRVEKYVFPVFEFELVEKPVEKWSVGSYVVFLIDYGYNKIGEVSQIVYNGTGGVTVDAYLYHNKNEKCNLFKDTECKWFATLAEAEAFAKTLNEMKWCVKPSSSKAECSAVLNWFNKNGECEYTSGLENNYYWHFPAYSASDHCSLSIEKGYTEITFEQFKQITNMEELNITIPKGYEVDWETTYHQKKVVLKEINKLPMKWEDLERIDGYYVCTHATINSIDDGCNTDSNHNVFPTEALAKASLAMAQLTQLHQAWFKQLYGVNPTDYVRNGLYWIKGAKQRFFISQGDFEFSSVLFFEHRKDAQLFMSTFNDLLIEALPLL